MEATLEQFQDPSQEGRCPYCHDQFGDWARAVCTVCDATQHLECFFEHKSCSVHGCENAVISHQGTVFSYAEMQAFESFEDFQFFVNESLALSSGQAQVKPIKAQQETRVKINYSAILLALLLYPALLVIMSSFFQPNSEYSSFMTLVLNILCIFAIFWFSVRLETVETSEDAFEEHHARRMQERLEGKALQLAPFSFWRDVMGQRGFDPLTGMSPGTLELPLLEEDEREERRSLKDDRDDDSDPEIDGKLGENFPNRPS